MAHLLSCFISFIFKEKKHRIKLNHLHYGPGFSNDFILKELKESKVKFTKVKNIEKKIAQLIVNKNIVARFSERMEFEQGH